MRSNRQGADRARPGGNGVQAASSRRSGWLVKGGLVLLATLFVPAAPAHARSAPELTHGSAAQQGAGVGFAEDPALLGDATSRGRLPFAGPDLVILILGGTIVTVAAAGAPLLLRPLRAIPPVLVAATAPSEPLLPANAQGAAAHAHA